MRAAAVDGEMAMARAISARDVAAPVCTRRRIVLVVAVDRGTDAMSRLSQGKHLVQYWILLDVVR
ncbi:hypothetical protein GCM10028798_07550 [Humibacter antri]